MAEREEIVVDIILRSRNLNIMDKRLNSFTYDFNASLQETARRQKIWNDRIKRSIAEFKKQEKAGKSVNNAFREIRLQFLGVMFGGQALSRMFGSMLDPIKEATGIQDLWNATLLESTTDAIEPMIDMVSMGGSAIETLNKATGGNLGLMLVWGETVGNVLDKVGQGFLFFDSLKASWPEILKTLQGVGKIAVNFVAEGWEKVAGIISDITAWSKSGWNMAVKFADNALVWLAGLPLWAKNLVTTGILVGTMLISFAIGASLGKWLEDNFGNPLDKFRDRIMESPFWRFIIGSFATYGQMMRAIGIGGPIPELSQKQIGGFISGHAEGGIVTRPHLGMVGEAGPEAIIPLNRAGAFFGDTIVNVNIGGGISSGVDAESFARIIATRVREDLRSSMGGGF